MPKDPAILFYFDNWRGGTLTMTRHLKGCYMDLLDAQFHSGHLSLDEIKTILGPDFSAWQTLHKKFKQDVNKNWFNERMELEVSKRKSYSESRSNNRKKKDMIPDMKNISTSYDPIIKIEIKKEDQEVVKHDGRLLPKMVDVFKELFPDYPVENEIDYPACLQIAHKIANQKGWMKESVTTENMDNILIVWRQYVDFIFIDNWFSKMDLVAINKQWQKLIQSFNTKKPGAKLNGNAGYQYSEREKKEHEALERL